MVLLLNFLSKNVERYFFIELLISFSLFLSSVGVFLISEISWFFILLGKLDSLGMCKVMFE